MKKVQNSNDPWDSPNEKFALRLPAAILEDLRLRALSANRSINSEIQMLLKLALKGRATASELSDSEIISEAIKRFQVKLFAEITVTQTQLVAIEHRNQKLDEAWGSDTDLSDD